MSWTTPGTCADVHAAPFQCHTVVVQPVEVQLPSPSAHTSDLLTTANGPPEIWGIGTSVQVLPSQTKASWPMEPVWPNIHTSFGDDDSANAGLKLAGIACLCQAEPFQCKTSGRVVPFR